MSTFSKNQDNTSEDFWNMNLLKSKRETKRCMVCYNSKDLPLLRCVQCKLEVHPFCYGAGESPSNPWLCDYCQTNMRKKEHAKRFVPGKACILCRSKKFGALKEVIGPYVEKNTANKSDKQMWAHLICAYWFPFTCIADQQKMGPIIVPHFDKYAYTHTCAKQDLFSFYFFLVSLLRKNIFVPRGCIKCRAIQCNEWFHPLCCYEKRYNCLKFEKYLVDGRDSIAFYLYCRKHVTLHQVNNIFKLK
ncbi:trithorax-like protein, histone-lysine N-methyltransferase [Reticulomyxa filosa]|uniref:Trithorax-like protein, histone-lysine N-methyltransferase n=1 Tax=Reticulomyxa filosa TaxID=46433 RepID=X6PCV7_RETFI|nr:trithorax-like protein, histone-lysine N-methyltransferase [Reticulomyxa filosa]|eukprot:ETO35507.1 trithorax-like protein, histone-lysine N-methyltransferase [Reticulomyxa filosa]